MEVTCKRSRLEAGGLAQRPPSQELRACQGVPLPSAHRGVRGACFPAPGRAPRPGITRPALALELGRHNQEAVLSSNPDFAVSPPTSLFLAFPGP